ncbi:hypothetical protein V7112_02890 [Bacillus sp. JJ1566]|uniref:hypothetical protein n=1 Tax=Bacillus sp. JJ1566 TaxID=3122961 RepID=UPI002FFE115F
MKWKNYGLWVSLASILYMVFKDLGMQIDLTTWETYVTAIIGFLAALGIISNPEKGKGFFDKIPDTPAEAISQLTEQLQNQPPTSGLSPHNLNPGNNQQSQGYPQPQQTNVNQQHQNAIQNSSNPSNFQQNEYQGYPTRPNEVQQTDANPNGATHSNDVEQTQVQPEVNTHTDQYAEPSFQEQTPDNTSFDRTKIHGMPAPPNEHM